MTARASHPCGSDGRIASGQEPGRRHDLVEAHARTVMRIMSEYGHGVDFDDALSILMGGCRTSSLEGVLGIVERMDVSTRWTPTRPSTELKLIVGGPVRDVIEINQAIADALDDTIPTISRLRRAVAESPAFGRMTLASFFDEDEKRVATLLRALAEEGTVTVVDYAERRNLTDGKIDSTIDRLIVASWEHAPGTIPAFETCESREPEITTDSAEIIGERVEAYETRRRLIQADLSRMGHLLSHRQVDRLLAAGHGLPYAMGTEAPEILRSGRALPAFEPRLAFRYVVRIGGQEHEEAKRIVSAATLVVRSNPMHRRIRKVDSHLCSASAPETDVQILDRKIGEVVAMLAGNGLRLVPMGAMNLLREAMGGTTGKKTRAGKSLVNVLRKCRMPEKWSPRHVCAFVEHVFTLEDVPFKELVHLVARTVDARIPNVHSLREIVQADADFGKMSISDLLAGIDDERAAAATSLASIGTTTVAEYAARPACSPMGVRTVLEPLLRAGWMRVGSSVPPLEMLEAEPGEERTRNQDEIDARVSRYRRKAIAIRAALTMAGYAIDTERSERILVAGFGRSPNGEEPLYALTSDGNAFGPWNSSSLMEYLQDTGGFTHTEALSIAGIAVRTLRDAKGAASE